MPFIGTTSGNFGYGRAYQAAEPAPAGNVPSYYTSSSGYLSYYFFNATSNVLKTTANFSNTTSINSYTGIPTVWNIVQDKDLDSNVYYGMRESGSPKTLFRIIMPKGGGVTTSNIITTYSGATTSVLGACYAPACMWTSTTGYGAFIIGGFNQAVVHVLEFTAAKAIGTTYTVAYTSEVYGTEVIPSGASGFTFDFGVAYTRNSKQMSSWTVDMSARSWTNRKDNSYTSGVNGPNNGLGMIYYPPGKAIFAGDPDTATNRLAMNDTSSSSLFVWTVTQSGTQLVWTYLKTVTGMPNNGGYPYHLSVNSYNAIS